MSTAQTLVPTGTWNVDPTHTVVEFGIKHLMITTVKGHFAELEGSFVAREDGTVTAEGKVKTASVDTNEPKRDEHLRSADFFDAENFPEITFTSTGVEQVSGNHFTVHGDLTIRGVTRPFDWDTTVAGVANDPWGNERVGIELHGTVNPTDFGVDWNAELESGGNLVGDKADLTVNVEAIKQK
jgi:polyisoprenoid-binding protein YceI